MVVIDTSKKGLEMIYKEWEVPLYKKLLNEDIEMNSRMAWKFLEDELFPQTKSRASVINSLNDNVEKDILKFREETGKGGYHRIYSRKMTLKEFWKCIFHQIEQALEPYL